MPDFVPGQEYDLREVRSELGATRVNESFVLGRGGIALLVDPGPAEDRPSFPDRDTLHWPGELPKRVVETKNELLVFVRHGEQNLRYVGAGRMTSYSAGNAVPRDVRFRLTPPLKRSSWLELNVGYSPPEGPAPEAPLLRLKPESSSHDRWRALEAFLERWYQKPLGRMAPVSPGAIGPLRLHWMLGVQAVIPEAVQFNQLVRSEKLAMEDGKLLFLVENQGVYLWATEPAGEDPRVWYRINEEGEPWIEEPERLSGFLIQAILFEAILHARFGANATALPDEKVQAILARVDPLGIGHWNWGRAQFFARDGALIMTMENCGANDVHLASLTPLALSCFEDLVPDDWDRVAF